jgi:hypothetical protein
VTIEVLGSATAVPLKSVTMLLVKVLMLLLAHPLCTPPCCADQILHHGCENSS